MRLTMLLAIALVATGCSKPAQTFTTTMKVQRVTPFGAAEAPTILDLELGYADCPGDEEAVVRGDKEFAACARKLKVGDAVQAEITYVYNAERQQYRSDLVKIGDCARKVDPKDDATYELVRSCSDVKVHGVSMGVHCDKSRNAELVAKCPWFYRK